MIRRETHPGRPLVNMLNGWNFFFILWNCFYLYWAIGDGLGNIAGYAPAGNGPFYSSWDNVYSFFFFLELLLLLEEASLGPPWRRVFPSVGGGGGTHCFLTLRVTNWFLFRETSSSWEDFHCQLSLQDHYKPAPDWKKDFFSWVWRRQTGLPFHSPESPGTFAFTSFWWTSCLNTLFLHSLCPPFEASINFC